MTGVSATTAGSTVIVGIIGVLMIWLGGRSILAGEMTLGDLIMASSSSVSSRRRWCRSPRSVRRSPKPSPGLDRIREILDMPTEVDEDASAGTGAQVTGDVAFDDVWFGVQRRATGAARCVLRGARRHDNRARRFEGSARAR